MAIMLTKKAEDKVKEILAEQPEPYAGLRIQVVGGGCSEAVHRGQHEIEAFVEVVGGPRAVDLQAHGYAKDTVFADAAALPFDRCRLTLEPERRRHLDEAVALEARSVVVHSQCRIEIDAIVLNITAKLEVDLLDADWRTFHEIDN